jgi:hypothetical protein
MQAKVFEGRFFDRVGYGWLAGDRSSAEIAAELRPSEGKARS